MSDRERTLRKPPFQRVLAGIATVATAATIATVATGATTSTAGQAVALRGAGYVWANSPTSSVYTPDGNYSYNSSNLGYGAPINTVTWLSTGRYQVTYPNIGVLGGTAHVTAYGSGTEQCKIEGWGPNVNSGQDVTYRCFGLDGELVDTQFSGTFTNINAVYGGARLAYLWTDQPSTPIGTPYTPSATYQFNSSGGLSTITRSDVGTYTVEIPGAVSYGGHIQATAYGSGTERCKVAGWGTTGVSMLATVRCFTLVGQSANSRFTLTFADQTNILGLSVFDGSSGHPTTYAWTHDSSSESYTPASNYAFGGGSQGLLATHTGAGAYGMRIGNAARFGNVQITAYGWGSEYCKVAYWTEASGIQIRCFDGTPTAAADTLYYGPEAAAVDTLYDVAHTGPYIIG